MTRFRSSCLALILAVFALGAYVQPSSAIAQAATASQTPATADAGRLDINTATADQLKSIKGIGDAYSKRIIAGRPYTAKNQLNTRGIIPPATYNAIKDQIIAKAPKK